VNNHEEHKREVQDIWPCGRKASTRNMVMMMPIPAGMIKGNDREYESDIVKERLEGRTVGGKNQRRKWRHPWDQQLFR
jgi:hypothetical protein